MTERRLDLVRYRTRSTFRHRRGGYLALIILLGLVGGLGLGSLAAARRTQSSFSDLLATTNPSDLEVSIYSGGNGGPNVGSSALTRKIARLPGVRHVAAGFVVTGAPLTSTGRRDPGHGVGLSGGQRERSLLYPGSDGAEPGSPGVTATGRRNRRRAGRRQAARVARRSGHPVRVLLERAAEPAGLRDEGRATGTTDEHEDRWSGIVEFRDRRGRRRYPADVHTPDTSLRRGGAGARRIVGRPELRHQDIGRAINGAARRARDCSSHPARRPGHRPRVDTRRRQGGPLPQADLHRLGGVRSGRPSRHRSRRHPTRGAPAARRP